MGSEESWSIVDKLVAVIIIAILKMETNGTSLMMVTSLKSICKMMKSLRVTAGVENTCLKSSTTC